MSDEGDRVEKDETDRIERNEDDFEGHQLEVGRFEEGRLERNEDQGLEVGRNEELGRNEDV